MIGPIWTPKYLLTRLALAVFVAVFLPAIPVLADPEPLSDGELDAVSARGVSFPSLGFGKHPLFPSVVSFVPTSAENETEIRNIVFALTNTTNINTAVNTCVYAVCENSGASIESNPVNETNLDLNNQVLSTVQNLVSAPVLVSAPSLSSSTNAFPTGFQAYLPSAGPTPQITQPPTGLRPPLPTLSNGIR